MKKILLFVLCLVVVGCATVTAYNLNQISLGMSKAEVIKVLGEPASTAATDGTEYLNYVLRTGKIGFYDRVSYHPYFVCIQDGKVASYGQRGDFDSTKDPTRVIKILGDVKSDEKIDISRDGNLHKKLAEFKKLLDDGLITREEFETQKQKLLDNYTTK